MEPNRELYEQDGDVMDRQSCVVLAKDWVFLPASPCLGRRVDATAAGRMVAHTIRSHLLLRLVQ